jgi:hypothetical protein
VAQNDIAASGIVGRSQGDLGGRPWHRWRRTVALGVVLLGLVGIVLVALAREALLPRSALTVAVPPNPFAPPRPALTQAEEAYARGLWKIHDDVKLGAVRMTFAGLAYKTGEIDRATLKARVDAARDVYARAEIRARGLEPPPSLRRVHADYLDAIRLYRQSAVEMARLAADGREQHLLAAYPLSERASKKLLEVGDVLWPGEYVPN